MIALLTRQRIILPLIKKPVSFLYFTVYFMRMFKKISPYWLCQIGGWSAYYIVWTVIYLTMIHEPRPHFYSVLFTDAVIGLFVTHIMRFLINQLGLLKLNLAWQIKNLLIVTIVAAFIYSFLSVEAEIIMQFEAERMKGLTLFDRVLYGSIGTFLFLLIWNLLYFTYHYVLKSRNEQLDKVRLETTVKELELKTIKAHINPHFIFNALNSIRALVDEDPQRARTAITELSNLLRSSMQAENVETTTLEKELNIVKDYLALEHIRFEDRLHVEYDIDEETLDQPVPPMMLQTLVENAIKHGISKHKEGGMIRIISDYTDHHHELIVQNTGHLNGHKNSGGFGIASTQNRLKLLYGTNANFEIKDTPDNMVEARVIMPAKP